MAKLMQKMGYDARLPVEIHELQDQKKLKYGIYNCP